jgi:hypothetical protein
VSGDIEDNNVDDDHMIIIIIARYWSWYNHNLKDYDDPFNKETAPMTVAESVMGFGFTRWQRKKRQHLHRGENASIITQVRQENSNNNSNNKVIFHTTCCMILGNGTITIVR